MLATWERIKHLGPEENVVSWEQTIYLAASKALRFRACKYFSMLIFQYVYVPAELCVCVHIDGCCIYLCVMCVLAYIFIVLNHY